MERTSKLQWVTPGQIGVPNVEKVFNENLWQLAMEELKKI